MSDKFKITHLVDGNVFVGKNRWEGKGAILEVFDPKIAQLCEEMTFETRKGVVARFLIEKLETAPKAPKGDGDKTKQ